MKKPFPEQILNDGGYHLPQLLTDANNRLKEDGKHGKTCQLKRSSNSVTVQFNFEGQQNKGCGCNFTIKGIERAEQIARLVTSQLVAENFSWDWYYRLIGKKKKTAIAPDKKSCHEMLEEYKKHWLKENAKLKNPSGQWYSGYRHIEAICLQTKETIDVSIVKKIIESTDTDSDARTKTLNALLNFLDYHEINNFNSLIKKFKEKNKPIKKKKYIPDDREIEYIYNNGFILKPRTQKRFYYRYPQWQFLYSLLAVYGLRVHEAWNIANWDNPVRIKKGDWIVVDDPKDTEAEIEIKSEYDFVIPAILNPNNINKILCIKRNTKTGYRMAFPLSPQGKDWIKEFNLIGSLNIPDIPNPLEYSGIETKTTYRCSIATTIWFQRYDFSAHSLRHAYNHRGHGLGINPLLLAQSLGHSLQVNNSTYLNTMPESVKLENFQKAMAEQAKKQNELEELKIENIQLKAENEMLKAKLQLIQQERSGNL